MSQRFTEDAIPPPERVQLLRTLPQSGHEAGDTQISPACQMLLAVRAADRQRHLARMVGSPRQSGEQERPAGYRLTMMLRIGEAHEQAPPVVDQRYTARQQPAAFEIMRGEAAPAPLVLQLVERILAVGPIAIQLTERQDLAAERGHQRGVPPALPIRPDRGKAEPRLTGVAVIDDRQRTFQLAPQQNDPPLPAPTFQPQTGLVALPALAGIRPVRLGHRPLQCRLTFFVVRKRNKYARLRCSACAITGSMPQARSPRSSLGQRPRSHRSSNDHRPPVACLTLCWSPGCTSTLSTSRRFDSM